MSEHDEYAKFRSFKLPGMICELTSVSTQGIYAEVGIGIKPVDRANTKIKTADGTFIEWPEQYDYTPEFLHHLSRHMMTDFRFNYTMSRLYGITPIHFNSIASVRPQDENDDVIVGDYDELDDAPEIMTLVMGIASDAFLKMLNQRYGFTDNPYSHMQFGSISTVDTFLNFVDGETGIADSTDIKWGWFSISHEVLESTKQPRIMPATPVLLHIRLLLNNHKELMKYKKEINIFDFQAIDHIIRERIDTIISKMLFPYRGMNLELADTESSGRWLAYYFTTQSGPFTASQMNVTDFYVAVFFHPTDTRWLQCEPNLLTCRFECDDDKTLHYGLGVVRRTGISRALAEPLHSYLQSTPDVMCISSFANVELGLLYHMEVLQFHMIPGYLQMGTGLVFDNPECKGQPDMYCAVMRNGNTTSFIPIISRRLEFSGIPAYVRADCTDGDYVPILAQSFLDKDDNLTWEISTTGTCLMGRVTLPAVRYVGIGPTTDIMTMASRYFCPSVTATGATIAAARVDPPISPVYEDLERVMWSFFCSIINCCNMSMLYARLAISGETRDSFIIRCIEMWRTGVNIDFDPEVREAYMNAMTLLMKAKRLGILFGLTYNRTKELVAQAEAQYKEPEVKEEPRPMSWDHMSKLFSHASRSPFLSQMPPHLSFRDHREPERTMEAYLREESQKKSRESDEDTDDE